MAARTAAVVAAGGTCAAGGYWYYSARRRAIANAPPPVGSSLQPNKTLTCKLREREAISADTARFRFELPSDQHVLGLPTASHVLAVDGAMVYRAYTPITLDACDKGYFDLLVKRYPGGEFSEAFHRMVPGKSKMMFQGPVTTLRYQPNLVSCMGMVAGGTGITPMYQIIRTILRNPNDRTVVRLIYANRSEADILLRRELEALAEEHPDRLSIRFLVEARAEEGGDGGSGGKASGWWPRLWHSRPAAEGTSFSVGADGVGIGRVSEASMAGYLPSAGESGTAVLVCGPEGMLNHLCGDPERTNRPRGAVEGLFGDLGYDGSQIVEFSDRNVG